MKNKNHALLLKHILDYIPIGVVCVDAKGKIVLVSKEIKSILGYGKKELTGKSVDVLVPHPVQKKHHRLRADYMKNPTPRMLGHGRDLFAKRKDGSMVPVEIGLSPMRDNDGIFVIAAIADITERKRLENQIKEANRELTRSNRELDEFSRIVSHDLKAPLRGIANIADWLMKDYADRLNGEGRECLRELHSRATNMQKLIDSILRYSRVGRDQANIETVDLNKLIKDVTGLLAVPKNITISVAPKLPKVKGVRVQFVELFQNLIGNAVKFMDKEKGNVRIRCESEDGHWHFTVQDNGPGIAKEHFEKVFQIFQTLAPRDKDKSTGLGLTIVKKIVENHGGEIWLESEVGRGSVFHFTLPKN
ncbi:MAG: hypothetical protein A3F16_05960 [Deltaproteobacteria bacterium RIFCSPHIGHO2_12_FULL_43_9]|nr:MAG: hypothetical protein A3F16_05960 [Deltaproteobacteria bacterium RIFCSPHIGHO2_12_FULL_43_9]